MAAPHERIFALETQTALEEELIPKEELEYDAGVLDAGISLYVDEHGLNIRIQRTEKEILEPLTSFFSLDIKPHQWGWFLQANNEDARFILETFYPHVRLIKPIFGLAISYLDWRKTVSPPGTPEEKGIKKRYKALMLEMKKELYNYDIGPAPLSPRYLAGFMDQHRGNFDTEFSSGSLIVNIQLGNKSFIQHLQEENGGNTYPHQDPNPKTWRVIGNTAEEFLEKVSPFFRYRSRYIEDIGYISRKPGMPKRVRRG